MCAIRGEVITRGKRPLKIIIAGCVSVLYVAQGADAVRVCCVCCRALRSRIVCCSMAAVEVVTNL